MERKESYNKRDSRIKSILFGSVLLCIGVACFFLRRVLDPYQDTISLIGSICSIIGLVFTFRQVVKLVDISNASKDAIDEYKEDVNRLFSYSEIKVMEQQIDDVEAFLSKGQKKDALYRLKTIKDSLIDVCSNGCIGKEECVSISSYLPILEKHIINIQSQEEDVLPNIIIRDIECLKTTLTTGACQIKSK